MKQSRLFPAPQPLVDRLGAAFFRAAPRSPGVYRMFDGAGVLVYVGKARDLRARLGSYRRTHGQSSKTRRMIHEVCRIEWQVTATEVDARLLENELIRTLRPRFNRAGTWPASARFVRVLERPEGGGFELWVVPTPEGESYGAFRGGAGRVLASLARLAWYAHTRSTSVTTLPRRLVASQSLRQWLWSVPAEPEWLMNVRAYLSGQADSLIGRLVDRVADPATEFERAFVAADFECLTDFFRRGPYRNAAMRQLLPGERALLSPEERDDLWVRWSAEHEPRLPRLEFTDDPSP